MFEAWKFRIRIKEIRDGAENVVFDKGRFKKDKKTGEVKFQLRKYIVKEPTQPVTYDFISHSKKGDLIDFVSPNPSELYLLKLDKDEKLLKPQVNENVMNRLAWENKQATIRFKKKSGWDWILPVIPLVIVTVVSIFALIFFMNSFGDFVKETVAPLQATAQETQLAARNTAEGMRLVTEELKIIVEILQAMGFQVNMTVLNQTINQSAIAYYPGG